MIVFLRILFGFFFIFSGLVKLYPVEYFQHTLAPFTSWLLSPLAARLIISFEIILGLFLCIGIYTKKTIRLTQFTLIFFTLYLIYGLILNGNNDDCGCFGTFLQMSPLASIGKNVFLFVLLIIIQKYDSQKLIHSILNPHLKNLVFVVISSGIALPFILNPWQIFKENPVSNKIGSKINFEEIGNIDEITPQEMAKGKKIVCFFSMQCKFCRLAANKLTILNSQIKLPAYYIFFGHEEGMEDFWNFTHSFHFPYKIIDSKLFFDISESEIPCIFLVENGVIKERLKYYSLNDKIIADFLNK